MSEIDAARTTLDGISKQGAMYAFTVPLDPAFAAGLVAGEVVTIDGTPLAVTEYDGEYATLQIPLDRLTRTDLVSAQVGDEVVVARRRSDR